MSQIAVIAEPPLAVPWAQELQSDGHKVDCHWGASAAETLFAGETPEIVVIDIENPEWVQSLLISQSRAKWPCCKVIAVVSSYAFRSSAVYKMGLWKPDQLLLKPLTPRVLAATASFLWAQLRTEEIKQSVAGNSHDAMPGSEECVSEVFSAPFQARLPGVTKEDSYQS
ncbi:MAG: hypothetical protein AB8B85_15775 [Paracoccaceae bacterium]